MTTRTPTMTLETLPLSLQQCLLLEWLSPECVYVAAQASGAVRRAALSLLTFNTASSFRAAEGKVLSDACIVWFHKHALPLVLWTTVERDKWVLQTHKCNGKLHRDGDLPAVVWADGAQEWFQNDELHRDGDLPAAIYANGFQAWYQHGKLHRDGDMAARIFRNGTLEWYQNGKLHRDGDLPAVMGQDGSQEWYQHGERYRNDGNDGNDILSAFQWFSARCTDADILAKWVREWVRQTGMHAALIAGGGVTWTMPNGSTTTVTWWTTTGM